MARRASGSDGNGAEFRARMDQIERDLARILEGMDGSAPANARQAFAIGASGSAARASAFGGAAMTEFQAGFEFETDDAKPKSFMRSRARFVRGLIRQRRQRERHFPADMFADPAWDMMLDLYAAHYEGRQDISVSSLCIASAVPATTALRWIKSMTGAGVFARVADPHDGRRIFIRLADATRRELDSYFDNLEE